MKTLTESKPEQVVLRLRRSLVEPLPLPVWPEGVRLITFEPERHAEQVHALLVEAYAQGGGRVEPFQVWWPGLKSDAEYDPALCFIVVDEDGKIVGVAQCWTSAFLKDLAVSPTIRKRGLGSALLLKVFHAFQERGAKFVDLKVEANNPTGAVRLYRSHGMQEVEANRVDYDRNSSPNACSMAGLPSRST